LCLVSCNDKFAAVTDLYVGERLE